MQRHEPVGKPCITMVFCCQKMERCSCPTEMKCKQKGPTWNHLRNSEKARPELGLRAGPHTAVDDTNGLPCTNRNWSPGPGSDWFPKVVLSGLQLCRVRKRPFINSLLRNKCRERVAHTLSLEERSSLTTRKHKESSNTRR